jgi:hypothetical protein
MTNTLWIASTVWIGHQTAHGGGPDRQSSAPTATVTGPVSAPAKAMVTYTALRYSELRPAGLD